MSQPAAAAAEHTQKEKQAPKSLHGTSPLRCMDRSLLLIFQLTKGLDLIRTSPFTSRLNHLGNSLLSTEFLLANWVQERTRGWTAAQTDDMCLEFCRCRLWRVSGALAEKALPLYMLQRPCYHTYSWSYSIVSKCPRSHSANKCDARETSTWRLLGLKGETYLVDAEQTNSASLIKHIHATLNMTVFKAVRCSWSTLYAFSY